MAKGQLCVCICDVWLCMMCMYMFGVCVCLCMHVCKGTCIHIVYTHTCVCVCLCVCVRAGTHVCTCFCVNASVYVFNPFRNCSLQMLLFISRLLVVIHKLTLLIFFSGRMWPEFWSKFWVWRPLQRADCRRNLCQNLQWTANISLGGNRCMLGDGSDLTVNGMCIVVNQ